jgi:hypothetical protein
MIELDGRQRYMRGKGKDKAHLGKSGEPRGDPVQCSI